MADASRSRLAYIDWARGLAVLLMIGAHVTDAWTRPLSRHGAVFRDVVILGGFAAPLFLWLAGLAVVLAATRAVSVQGRALGRAEAVKAICRRGLEIFILAFLFRFQAFVVTPGSYLVSVFHVDILNIMGPAIALTALIWGMSRTMGGAVALYAMAATAMAMATPIVRESAAVDVLPIWAQWYVRPSGDHATFTMFPWAGFVFAGGACGALIAGMRSDAEERRLQAALGLVGIALVALGFLAASRPSIYRASSFWTSSPTWFLIRVGVLMAALAVLYACSRLVGRDVGGDWLSILGRNSLFVYWIHVELVYGYLAWPVHGRLPLWGTACGFVLFSALMYRAIDVRDWVLDRWRSRFHHIFA